MKQALTRTKREVFHFVDGQKIAGCPTGLRGDVTGLWGDVSGLWGDVDYCEITDDDRKAGISVSTLIKPEAA